MSMLRYDPFKVMDEFNQLFNQGIAKRSETDPSKLETSQWSPDVDIIEKPEKFIFHFELAGVKKDNIDISMDGNMLSVKGHKESITEDKNDRYHRTERSYGEFHRQFSLPEGTDANNIAAKFSDGVLELEVPKVEKQKIKSIEIKS